MTDWPNIAGLIRELRQRANLTQEKLAARLGVTFSTINRWENGRANPSPLARKQIEHCLRELRGEGRDLLATRFGKPAPRQEDEGARKEPRRR